MLLRYEDRNSMAYSIESRVPFLTPQLARFVLSLPEAYLIDRDGTIVLEDGPEPGTPLADVLPLSEQVLDIETTPNRPDLAAEWDGRTLEWLTLSPPPHYNFAVLPDVHGEEAYWTRKQTAIKMDQLIKEPDYQPIEMPVNTPTGRARSKPPSARPSTRRCRARPPTSSSSP